MIGLANTGERDHDREAEDNLKKWIHILPTNLAVPLSHLLSLSLSKLLQN